MTDSPQACPHPALRATFSLREKGRGGPSPSGRRWTRDRTFWKDARPSGRAMARPDEGRGCQASRSRPLEPPTSAQRKRLAFISTVLTLAAFSSGCVPETKIETNPDCVAGVNKAALQAMNRTRPLGQMTIFGPPTSFGPHLMRVEVRVFGGRTELYAVDVTIDNACNILGASTRLEASDWDLR
jgi:hypothetical protein